MEEERRHQDIFSPSVGSGSYDNSISYCNPVAGEFSQVPWRIWVHLALAWWDLSKCGERTSSGVVRSRLPTQATTIRLTINPSLTLPVRPRRGLTQALGGLLALRLGGDYGYGKVDS